MISLSSSISSKIVNLGLAFFCIICCVLVGDKNCSSAWSSSNKTLFMRVSNLKAVNDVRFKQNQFNKSNWQFIICLTKSYQEMDVPLVFKIIVLGQQGVGKSSMLIRYMKGEFSTHYNVTVGVEFASKTVTVDDGKQLKLQIWDTAGQQAFRAIVRSFYKGIAAVFLTFAMDVEDSLDALKIWQKEVREHGHQEIIFFLVGTRADLETTISREKINKMMRELESAFFIETSAKTGMNIQQLFSKAAETMYKKYIINQSYQQLVNPTGQRKRQKSFALTPNRKSMEKKNKCCS